MNGDLYMDVGEVRNKVYYYYYYYITSIGTRSAFLSMKAAELKCQNLIVKKVCQVEHFKTFRKAIGQELGLYRQKISATDRGERERHGRERQCP